MKRWEQQISSVPWTRHQVRLFVTIVVRADATCPHQSQCLTFFWLFSVVEGGALSREKKEEVPFTGIAPVVQPRSCQEVRITKCSVLGCYAGARERQVARGGWGMLFFLLLWRIREHHDNRRCATLSSSWIYGHVPVHFASALWVPVKGYLVSSLHDLPPRIISPSTSHFNLFIQKPACEEVRKRADELTEKLQIFRGIWKKKEEA